ncbi:MAG: hypothetical protein JNK70_13440, partial [Phycisphaerae bacterium]|nr:hypothetical protein [Phycisphaerae bacterium]
MVTSCLIGVLLLSAAVWSYRELEAFVIPTKEWNITVAIDHSGHATAPALAPGGSVEFFAPGSGIHDTGPRAVTGVVHEIRQVPGDHNATIVVRDISAVQKAAVPERNQVAVIGSARALVTATQAVPYFDLLYLQAGVVGLILVAGAIF